MANRTNFAYSTVATAPVPAASGTTMSFAAGGGALMPAVPYRLVVFPTGVQPLASNAEVVLVTAQSGDNVTAMTRGSSPRTIIVGDQADNGITSEMLDETQAVNMSPNVDIAVPAGYSLVVARKLTIASGKKVTIGSGAILRVL